MSTTTVAEGIPNHGLDRTDGGLWLTAATSALSRSAPSRIRIHDH